MKSIVALIGIIGITSFTVIQQSQIDQKDLKTTCGVLSKLTHDAIDNNRSDLIALYYNAYKAIRKTGEITDGCDNYFDAIKTSYGSEIGHWNLDLDFPPKYLDQNNGGGFTHKELETLGKFKELNLTIEDLQHVKLLKGITENTVDLQLLKASDANGIKQLNDNLNKLKIETIDYSKLNALSNDKLKIEQLQNAIND